MLDHDEPGKPSGSPPIFDIVGGYQENRLMSTRRKTQTDEQLIAGCRTGSPEAWRTLVSRYERLVYAIPRRYGLTQQETDDVFQTVWMALLRRLPNLQEPDRVSAWLVTTTKRECWDRRRKGDYRHTVTVDPQLMPEDSWMIAAGPDEIVAEFEQNAQLHKAWQRLTDRCRSLLWHLYYDPEDPGYAEIAQETGMAVGSIGPTRTRCLEKLRQFMRDLT